MAFNRSYTTKPSRWHRLAALCLAVGLAGCASTPKRNPLPAELVDRAQVIGGAAVRTWGDGTPRGMEAWFALSDDELRQLYPDVVGSPHSYLAISGGGRDGAFAAGLLCGWSEHGTRPEFTLVTGISAGALIAPFAFLGPEYDDLIRRFYTTSSTKDIINRWTPVKSLRRGAIANSEPLRQLLAEVVDEELVRAIAAEHRRGRVLVVGTTNLDANRPVHWSITRIAATGDPGAVELIREILLASASIPAVMPPVLIDVEADGATYDELHVDGGATALVFSFPAGLDVRRILDRLDVPEAPDLYVITNAQLVPTYAPVKPRLFGIIERSVLATIRSKGIGNLYQIFHMAVRDGLAFHLAFIPPEFDLEQREPFDPDYMKALFEIAHDLAVDGYPWASTPPGYGPVDEPAGDGAPR
jgi:hypothetical protein